MKHFKALVISDENISAKILNWKLESVKTVEDALAILQQSDYRIIAMDDNIKETDKQKLEAVAKLFNKEVSIVRFSSNEELISEIGQAYRNQRVDALNHKVLDNAFEIELACKLNMN